MFPVLLELGEFSVGSVRIPLTITTYGLCFALGILLGWRLFVRWGNQRHPHPRLSDIYIGSVAAAFIGGKLANLVVFWRLILDQPKALVGVILGGGHFLGGVIGGLVTFCVLCRIWQLDIGEAANSVFAILPLTHVIGRIGCFLAGCCYGIECHHPWAVVFTDPRANQMNGTPLNVPLHPTQLYEAGLELLNFFLCYRLWRQKPGRWSVITLWAALYGMERFLLEFLRDDARGQYTFLISLTTSQWLSLALSLTTATIFFVNLRKRKPAA